MFNPKAKETRFYFDQTLKEKEHGDFDDLWRTAIGYLIWRDPILLESINNCIKEENGKLKIYRSTTDDGLTTSRDLVLVLVGTLMMSDQKELGKRLAKDISFRISKQYWCLPSTYCWLKFISTEKVFLKYLFYFFFSFQILFLIPWTLLIYKIYNVTPQDEVLFKEGRYNNQIQKFGKVKRFFLSKTFQSFAILYYAFQLRAIKSNNLITKILLSFTKKVNPSNIFVRKFLNDKNLPNIIPIHTNDFLPQRFLNITTDVAIWKLGTTENEFNSLSYDALKWIQENNL